MKTNAPTICRPGDDPNITAAKLLIMAGQMLIDPSPGISDENKKSANVFIEGVLAAAALGGYAKCTLLRAGLGSPQRSARLLTMAREACKAAGPAAIRELMAGKTS